MLGGVRLVMPEGRFEPEQALQLIEDEGVTIWATVPTMVWRVCEYPDRHDYDTSHGDARWPSAARRRPTSCSARCATPSPT